MEAASKLYGSILFSHTFLVDDPRVQAMQRAMLDATPDCIKVLSVDGMLVNMNKAGCLALGVPIDSEFGMPWLPLLPACVHQAGLEALNKAAKGESARFPGQSEGAGGVRYWDNLLTPIVDGDSEVVNILCVSRDVTANVKLEKELKDAISREKLLSREIRHRVKNLFSIVSGLSHFSEKEAARKNRPDLAIKLLRDKLNALSMASDVSFMSSWENISDLDKVDVGSIIKAVLQPYVDRYVASGDISHIDHTNLTNIALCLHEFATNSMKYGAFSEDVGRVTITWASHFDTLQLLWRETGGPAIAVPPSDIGFGSEMIDRVIRGGGGNIDRQWLKDGLVIKLSLPCYRV